jgi:regulator of cell morphogenesis and NO signaling
MRLSEYVCPKIGDRIMSTSVTERSVGELVAEQPGRSRIFESFGIDFCCGGKIPLQEACAKKKVPVEDVVRMLLELDDSGSVDAEPDFASMPLDELADHIVERHHEHLCRELPRLQGLATKVAKVHFDSDERLKKLEDVLYAMSAELMQHMIKEERVLFPVIREMVQGHNAVAMPCGALSGPIGVMESEHDAAGDDLEVIKNLTNTYTPPEGAYNSYRALFDGLRELEFDIHQHIHKENNILFPKALEMERVLDS